MAKLPTKDERFQVIVQTLEIVRKTLNKRLGWTLEQDDMTYLTQTVIAELDKRTTKRK